MTIARDTWIIFSRAMRLSLRQPVWVVFGLLQPILYLALFGPLLETIADTRAFGEDADAWQIFVPGLLVQLGLFGASFVGFGLISEWRSGVIERMRVTPASRASLLLGRVMRDVVVLLVQGTILVLVALLFGLRAPWWALVAGVGTVALLGACFASLSYAVALTLKSEDSFAPLLNGVALPLLLLSGILLPMSLAPRWLQLLSDANPLKHVVEGVRAMFRGELGDPAALWGVAITVGLVLGGIAIGTRVFRRQSA
ncbi:ABC transporter permease [Demequina muriae]|uniref:Transport permease protein n=1 Tax=Demequina muriae TaxID=3051664 RepID=A0ABT8GH74_9MICO|nr:ABC transporter permease [Demequina sp. EGI L300058]MDN4480619.1 ABC transporter permease [Demequina sp. EGI L300058]